MQGKNHLLQLFYYIVYVAMTFAVISLLLVLIVILKEKFNPKTPPTPVATIEEIWVSKEITVCNEPWQQKKLSPKIFFSSQGVQVSDTITRQTGTKTCNDCPCLNGETLYFKISPESLNLMPGFKRTDAPRKDIK